jgi:Ca2+-binding EF-hand superfamily protein
VTTAATDAIRVRIERSFDAIDANHDGYVDWSDCQNLVDRYRTAYKLDKEDRRIRAMQSFQQMRWLELLRHAGVDGDRLSKEQFMTATRLASMDTSRFNMVEGLGHVIFDLVDNNGDNEITKDEFTRLLRDVWKVSAPDAMNTFDQLDTDGDGSVSRQEFIRATREYFYSNDRKSAGQVFFQGV